MAKRYRDFKRVRLTAKTAKKLTEIAEKIFSDHYDKCGAENMPCRHMLTGSLEVARLVESKLTIASHRAHIDIPDDPVIARVTAAIFRDFSQTASWAKPALQRIADEVDAWARRSPLEKLAEAGLELDT